MVQERTCDYTGEEIEPGTGKMYVKTDGTILWFKDSKAEKNYFLGRESRDLEWIGYEEDDEDDEAEELDGDEDEDGEADDSDADETEESDAEEEAEDDEADADEEDESADAEDESTEEDEQDEETEAEA